MNRRLRRSSTAIREQTYLRFLKPGALAQLRDSRISARCNRFDLHPQICLYRSQISPTPSDDVGQALTGAFNGMPCFTGRSYGPRCSQRKRLTACNSVFFMSSNPSSPVSDSPDPVIDVFSNDFLLSH